MTRQVVRMLDNRADSSPADESAPLRDWVQSQVLGLWLGRLIYEGHPDDRISIVHREHAWLGLMREHLGSS
ncbi:MAG: hypothetical protein Q8S09_08275 [Hyphomonas sp.]|nr:hypothetical protein [Hyphomonas sp.]